MSYESDKFIFNLSDMVRRALKQNAIPFGFNMSPDVVRKFDKVLAERFLPPRGTDKRPFLRLNDVPSLPFAADRSLKPGTVVLVTNKNLEGIAIDLSALKLPAMVEKPAEVIPDASNPIDKTTPPEGFWSWIKKAVGAFFGR